MKQLINRFWLPTPKKMRKLGYAILAGCTMLSITGTIAIDELMKVFSPVEIKIMIGLPMVLGFVGKIITSFFTEGDRKWRRHEIIKSLSECSATWLCIWTKTPGSQKFGTLK